MPWVLFRDKQRKWISEMAEANYTIDVNWYSQAYMWDRMDPEYPRVFFREALLSLSEHDGNVYFMSEGARHHCPGQLLYHNTRITNFVAQVDGSKLTKLIEKEWYASFRLGKQAAINYSPVLPEDLYVFDESMAWFVAFTHEASDLNAQFFDKMKAADSRICIIGKK